MAKATLLVLVVFAMMNGLWLARDIVFIGFLAVLFASFLSIFVDRLEGRVPRWAATLLVFLAWLGVLVLFLVLMWPSLQSQIATIRRDVPEIIDDVSRWIQTQVRAMAPGDGQAPSEEFARQINERMGMEAARIVGGALPLLNTVIGALAGLLIILFAGVFLTVSPRTYLNGFIELVPPRGRERTRGALLEAGTAFPGPTEPQLRLARILTERIPAKRTHPATPSRRASSTSTMRTASIAGRSARGRRSQDAGRPGASGGGRRARRFR